VGALKQQIEDWEMTFVNWRGIGVSSNSWNSMILKVMGSFKNRKKAMKLLGKRNHTILNKIRSFLRPETY
jgi:hypothetical protein